jgi:hypothetical protein
MALKNMEVMKAIISFKNNVLGAKLEHKKTANTT